MFLSVKIKMMDEKVVANKTKKILALEIAILVAVAFFAYQAYFIIQKNKTSFPSASQQYNVTQIPPKISVGEIILDTNSSSGSSTQNSSVNQSTAVSLSDGSYGKKTFRTFNYSVSGNQILEVSGSCVDKYYTI